jgi:hypothetical protein
MSQDSQVGVLKFLKLGLSRLWRPITLCAYLRLKWGLNKSYSFLQKNSNGMYHVTCTQGNQDDSRLLMVKNQIDNLILNTSFGHKLCFNYQNGSCKPILDIYISRAFQWYKELFHPIGFDPYNRSLKLQESIRSSTPEVGVHLGVWRFIPSHSPTLLRTWNVTPKLHYWPAPSQALALVGTQS